MVKEFVMGGKIKELDNGDTSSPLIYYQWRYCLCLLLLVTRQSIGCSPSIAVQLRSLQQQEDHFHRLQARLEHGEGIKLNNKFVQHVSAKEGACPPLPCFLFAGTNCLECPHNWCINGGFLIGSHNASKQRQSSVLLRHLCKHCSSQHWYHDWDTVRGIVMADSV